MMNYCSCQPFRQPFELTNIYPTFAQPKARLGSIYEEIYEKLINIVQPNPTFAQPKAIGWTAKNKKNELEKTMKSTNYPTYPTFFIKRLNMYLYAIYVYIYVEPKGWPGWTIDQLTTHKPAIWQTHVGKPSRELWREI